MKLTFLSLTLFFCTLGSIFPQAIQAQTMVQKQAVPPATEDSIRFSLLTCGAGEEIYSLFGHTAIRYENFTRGIDAVFNYGIFSFNTPNFILRFTLGETDYQLGVTSYKQFAYEYTWTGRDVWQQTLNLNAEEKKKLLALLEENYLPQNRIYRYNFFYDNCATRPRDQIERAVQGTLEYADDMTSFQTGISFRDIVHQYTIGHSWARFGIDLCLGSQADKDITRRQMMFAPFYLKDFLAKAQLKNAQGMERPLVSSEDHIIQSPQQTSTEETPSPLQTAFLLFTIVTIATAYGIYRRKSLWLLDLLLFLAAGVAGCILAFLASFSQHPAVSPNYLLFLFHPLHLLCLPWMIKRVRKKEKSIYMWANIIVLTFFILLWGIIPQEFNLAVLPLALSLWIRSASNLYLTYIRK
ncbi:lipoprotein N-acyltransferase Lnb [Bacteroides ndongoniae]|uniref:lipoprotein N-acyltransferase Lnb n=1 Tax=Bacteroides ndongoniae TaxID=1903262 RepID=UPI0008D9AE21